MIISMHPSEERELVLCNCVINESIAEQLYESTVDDILKARGAEQSLYINYGDASSSVSISIRFCIHRALNRTSLYLNCIYRLASFMESSVVGAIQIHRKHTLSAVHTGCSLRLTTKRQDISSLYLTSV
jgi:hypothetical protein